MLGSERLSLGAKKGMGMAEKATGQRRGPSGLLRHEKPKVADTRIEESSASRRPFPFWCNLSNEDHVAELALGTKGGHSG